MCAALGHEPRLAVLRLLMRGAPGGIPAGSISATLGMRPNTLSSNLSILATAGLIAAQRQGREIHYRVDLDGVARLMTWLVEESAPRPGENLPRDAGLA